MFVAPGVFKLITSAFAMRAALRFAYNYSVSLERPPNPIY